MLSVQGDAGRVDPTNLDRDRGPNILDQRHTFSGSVVAIPKIDKDGFDGAMLNDNVFGVAMQFASGIPVNLRSNQELNNDGTASDRPSGVARNSLKLPARYNVDCALLAPLPDPGRHGRRGDRRSEERVQHGAGQRRQRDDHDEHAGGAAGGAADERAISCRRPAATSSVSSSSDSSSSSDERRRL